MVKWRNLLPSRTKHHELLLSIAMLIGNKGGGATTSLRHLHDNTTSCRQQQPVRPHTEALWYARAAAKLHNFLAWLLPMYRGLTQMATRHHGLARFEPRYRSLVWLAVRYHGLEWLAAMYRGLVWVVVRTLGRTHDLLLATVGRHNNTTRHTASCR